MLSSSVDSIDSPLNLGSFNGVVWSGVRGVASSCGDDMWRTFVGLEVVMVSEFGRFFEDVGDIGLWYENSDVCEMEGVEAARVKLRRIQNEFILGYDSITNKTPQLFEKQSIIRGTFKYILLVFRSL